ncbi:MAG: EAL domain-containing protein [Pseudomonadota bacterium]
MFSAGQTQLLFSPRPGVATLDLVEMASDDIAPLLRSLLFRARRAAQEEPDKFVEGQLGLDYQWLAHISVFDPRRPGWLLVSFARLPALVAEALPLRGLGDAAELAPMRQELDANRAYLQQLVEDFEATTEQLQAANEELQSTNEEFHSTNEELQTTIEELRSTNEELHTVNDELNEKTHALAQSSRDLVQTLGSLNSTPLLVVDEQLRLRLFNPSLDRLAPVAELADGHNLSAIPWRDEIAGLRECVLRVIQRGVIEQRPVEMLGGSFQLSVNPYQDDQGQTRGAVLVFADVSELVQVEAKLREQEQQLRVTLAALREGVIRVDEQGDVIYANPIALHWFESGDLTGSSLGSLQVLHDGHVVNLGELVEPSLLKLHSIDAPYSLRRVELPSRKALLEISFVSIPGGGAMLVLHEISERARHEAELDRIGHHDHLTGLPNRRGLERLLELASERRRVDDERVCVVFIDLDQFKLVNDTSGHDAGDELLKRLSSLMLSELRPSDALARIGGDEFALLLPGTGIEVALRIVERLVMVVRAYQFNWEGQAHGVRLSCGVAELTSEGNTAKALLDAGAAASIAKKQGGNRVELASPDNPRLVERRTDQIWLLRLRDTPDEMRRLVPRFERIQALEGASKSPGNSSRWELLLRYQNDDGTLTAPGEFINTAERSGFIHGIDLRALDLALLALADAPFDTTMHVNVSPASILRGEEFVAAVEQRLKANPLQARQLSFELTETAVYREPDRMKDFMRRVSALGAQVWLDDFGAGSSTLSNLRLLPVHGIKIDGALVLRILDDEVDCLIVESLQRIATQMGLLTVAEFAETPELLTRLGELGVNFAQGWAVGRGLSADALHSHWRGS